MFKIRINVFFNLQYDFCYIFTIFEQQGKSAAWTSSIVETPRSSNHHSTTSPIWAQFTTFFWNQLLHRLTDNACERQLRTYNSLASRPYLESATKSQTPNNQPPSGVKSLKDAGGWGVADHLFPPSGTTPPPPVPFPRDSPSLLRATRIFASRAWYA